MGEMFVGFPPWGEFLRSLLMALAQNSGGYFHWYLSGVNLTFHYGNDVSWVGQEMHVDRNKMNMCNAIRKYTTTPERLIPKMCDRFPIYSDDEINPGIEKFEIYTNLETMDDASIIDD